jgi:hypothetical protein
MRNTKEKINNLRIEWKNCETKAWDGKSNFIYAQMEYFCFPRNSILSTSYTSNVFVSIQATLRQINEEKVKTDKILLSIIVIALRISIQQL